MPNKVYYWHQPFGTTEIATLMNDISDSFSSMNYECKGTGLPDFFWWQTDDMEDSFQKRFGYSKSIRRLDYQNTSNYDVVKDQIENNLPVLFTGSEKENFWFISYRGDGHAWVADGYRETQVCTSEGYRNTYLSFHMNWGWNGAYDGYYSFNNFKPGDYSYNYKSKIIVDIQP
ncbi:MAG: C10 family peptidase [Bacteroidota bacterium]